MDVQAEAGVELKKHHKKNPTKKGNKKKREAQIAT